MQHALGEVCIPVNSQRIISLDVPWTLDPLLALGIKPVGTAIHDYAPYGLSGLLPDEIEGIERVGFTGSASLEKILALKPDLILSLDVHDEQNYQQLSAIAPTVLREFETINTSFKENLRSIAQVVAQEETAEDILAQYQNRVDVLRESVGKRLQGKEISVIHTSTDGSSNIWIENKNANYFQILSDIGVSLKPIFTERNEWASFSIESISQFDADILFIISEKSASSLFQNPLISLLKAVQNNRAYVVDPSIWYVYGPLGMNRLLDDISKYLSEAIQSF
ncbi:iron-siderophore ABC transporter substrate-binding protein [Floridanema evergladense]|uniref:Iron-siderophore ABC transporter substrate-binding protein n=1 Tax=Floridaenema evergladense BLCC-F167 TaxID=3153639 RepID=A0ABV4WV89_9CYAN